jgi:hypothetical protein
MKSLLLVCGAIAAIAVTSPAHAITSTYTDVAACGGHDSGNDEFIHLCKGPDGLAAILHYFDGQALTVFCKNKGGGEIAGQPFNADDPPISVGGSGKVFGPKIEWVKSDAGKVCAAIVRVSTNKGSRLVTTALVGSRGRVSMSKTNEQARASAKKACGSSTAVIAPSPAGESPTDAAVETAAVAPASGKDLLPLKHGIFVDSKFPCKEFGKAYLFEIHNANKYAMSFWGDSVNDAFTVGKIIDVKRNGKTYKVKLDTEVNSPMGDFKGVVDQTFVISSATKVQTDRGYGKATFRWCYNEIP